MKKLFLAIAVIGLISGKPDDDELILFLRQELLSYSHTHPFVGVNLVFNQNKYALGDTAFFTVHAFDEDFIPLKGKKIFALTLIDGHGKPRQRIKFATINGEAFNQLAIPLEAESGLYHCIVCAEAGGAVLYSKELLIVEKNKIKIAADSVAESVAFFPEGGSIISGVKNRIVIKSRFNGIHIIRNDRNEEVTRVEVRKNRLSHFYLAPVAGAHYYCEVEGQSIRYDMPYQLSPDGVALSVISDEQVVSIELKVPDNSALRKTSTYVTVVNNRKIVFSKRADFTDSTTVKIILPEEVLHNGLNQVTVFNENKNILSERVFYSRKASVRSTLKTIDQQLKQREAVTEELVLADKNGNPISGNFAVSVFHKKFFEGEHDILYQDEFYLEQVPGIIQNINSEQLPAKDRLALIDDYLIMRNYKLISWDEILNHREEVHEQFGSSLKLKGKALFKEGGEPVPDSTAVMTYLQNSMIGYETKVIKGNFDLTFLYDFYDEDELFYSIEKRNDYLKEAYLAISEDPSPDFQIRPSNYIRDNLIDDYADHQYKKRMMDRSYTFFVSNDKAKITYVDPNSKYEDETGGVDMTINVHDYVVFHTMDDLIREVVPFLMVRTSKTQKAVRLLLNYKDHNVKPKGEPLFIIDGVLSKNSEYFLNINPADLLTIKLINNPDKLAQWGALGKNGIVLAATKRSATNAKKVPTNSVRVVGLNRALNFPLYDYSRANDKRIPDFRTVLYWNPQIKVNQNGRANFSFYTSDLTGEYCVQIKGLTDKGLPFEATNTFVVGR